MRKNKIMDFEGILQQAIDYGQHNTTVVLGAVTVLVLLTIFKPKAMMKLYGVCILALVGLYLFTLISGTLSGGIMQKDKMIYKTRDAIGE
jgi:hypothetical protein